MGYLEDVQAVSGLARDRGALTVCAVTEPVSLGLLRGPGGLGADIVVGEGQSFGVPLSFGVLRPEICLPERALELDDPRLCLVVRPEADETAVPLVAERRAVAVRSVGRHR